MNRDQKATVVEEIAEQIQAAQAVFAVDYRGLSVAQAADLRAKLRDSDTRFRIVKNSLSERAADKAGVESLKSLLVGPTALALVHGDAALAAKALSDTGRALQRLEFKGGLMNGATLSADEVRAIARLPAREILNAQLVGTIAAPISGLVRGLNALIAGLAIQLKAISDQGLLGGAAGGAEVEAEAQSSVEAEAESSVEAEAQSSVEAEAELAPDAEAAAEAELAPEPEAEAEQPQEPEQDAASDAGASDE